MRKLCHFEVFNLLLFKTFFFAYEIVLSKCMLFISLVCSTVQIGFISTKDQQFAVQCEVLYEVQNTPRPSTVHFAFVKYIILRLSLIVWVCHLLSKWPSSSNTYSVEWNDYRPRSLFRCSQFRKMHRIISETELYLHYIFSFFQIKLITKHNL